MAPWGLRTAKIVIDAERVVGAEGCEVEVRDVRHIERTALLYVQHVVHRLCRCFKRPASNFSYSSDDALALARTNFAISLCRYGLSNE